VLLTSFVRDWAAATGRLGRTNPPVAESAAAAETDEED